MTDNSHAKTVARLRTGREDLDELLRELYVERRFSQEEIAQHLGVHRITVGDWLKEYGISRADRTGLEPVA